MIKASLEGKIKSLSVKMCQSIINLHSYMDSCRQYTWFFSNISLQFFISLPILVNAMIRKMQTQLCEMQSHIPEISGDGSKKIKMADIMLQMKLHLFCTCITDPSGYTAALQQMETPS